jgi:hypothetical protein
MSRAPEDHQQASLTLDLEPTTHCLTGCASEARKIA